MDKDQDDDIYREQYFGEVELSHKKKILHTRILNLSLPENDFMYFRMGKVLLESGQQEKSFTWFKRATIVDPRNASAQIHLAKALFELGKESEAFSFIKKGLSKDSDLHTFLIETLDEKQRLQDLESFIEEIVKMMTDPKDISFFYYGIANALIGNKKYPEAIVNYRKAFENNSPMKKYHFETYGFALYQEGLFEEALVQFEHVRRLDPNERLAFNNIAHLNYCIGRVEEALEGFEYIIENELKSVSTYANFILVLLHLDQDEEVINQYKDLLQLDINIHRGELRNRYNEELRVTKVVLQKEDIDEKTKEFNTKKLEGINTLLSFLN